MHVHHAVSVIYICNVYSCKGFIKCIMLTLFVYEYAESSCVVYVVYLANTLHVSYQLENTSLIMYATIVELKLW